MNARMRYIQLGLEASIPLLGFFFWDWSLYFILLFYFIDLFAAEVIMHLKSRKIVDYSSTNEGRKKWVMRGAFSLSLLLLGVFIIHLSMLYIQEGIVFSDEVIAFWNYEDMGIKQGYLFVPLVLLLSYQQYRMEFLMPARYRKLSIVEVWRPHIQALVIIAGFAIFCLGVSFFFVFPEIVFVLGIVVFTVTYKLKLAD